MPHLYISLHADEAALEKERAKLVEWCEKNRMGHDCVWIEEGLTQGRVSVRQIRRLLEGLSGGDVLVVSSLPRLGRSLAMLTTVLEILCERGVTLITADDSHHFPPSEATLAMVESLRMAVDLEKTIKAQRSCEALFVSRGEGQRVGRPVGSKRSPQKHVLYGKYERLDALHAMGLSVSAIAHELGVSRGPVTEYLNSK